MCKHTSLLKLVNEEPNGNMYLNIPTTGWRARFTDKSTGEQKLHCDFNVHSETNLPIKQPGYFIISTMETLWPLWTVSGCHKILYESICYEIHTSYSEGAWEHFRSGPNHYPTLFPILCSWILTHGGCGSRQGMQVGNFRWHMHFIPESSIVGDSTHFQNFFNAEYTTYSEDVCHEYESKFGSEDER